MSGCAYLQLTCVVVLRAFNPQVLLTSSVMGVGILKGKTIVF